jgi:hypothetical protein
LAWFHTSRRTSSSASVAHFTIWSGSAQRTAFWQRSATTVAIQSAASADTWVIVVGVGRDDHEQVDVARGLHRAPRGRAEQDDDGRRGLPFVEACAPSAVQLISEVGQRDHLRRGEVRSVQVVGVGRADAVLVDQPLGDEPFEGLAHPLLGGRPDEPVDLTTGERPIGARFGASSSTGATDRLRASAEGCGMIATPISPEAVLMQISVQLHAETRILVLPLPLHRTMRLSHRAWLRLTVLDRRRTLIELMPQQAPACPLAGLGGRPDATGGSATLCCLGTTAPARVAKGACEAADLPPASLHAAQPAEARVEIAPDDQAFIQVYAPVQSQRRLLIPEAVAEATGIEPGGWRFTLLADRRALAEPVTGEAVVVLGAAGFSSARS